MACEAVRLDSLVDIMTGVPISRAKKIAEGDTPTRTRVLNSGAMSAGRIDDALLTTEEVSKVKRELFLKENDVVVKASTPYDCAFVDKHHEGLLATSFGLILRAKPDARIDMRCLAVFLGLERTNRELQSMSKGETIQLIKKRDLGDLLVPLQPQEEQARIASIYESTQRRKELCRAISEKSDLLLQSEFSHAAFDCN